MNLQKELEEYIDLIQLDNKFLNELDKDKYSQDDWDYIAENYEDLPEIIANKFIIKKYKLGKDKGLNFLILLYNQNFSEKFYSQKFIINLLNIDEYEYHNKMGAYNSLSCNGILWQNLFYARQWFFSKEFLLEHAEYFLDTYHLQRYQEVPIELYEKYIDDDRLSYMNSYDQDIPLWFIRKYIKSHHNKINLIKIMNVKDLTEDIFKEFINYPELKDEKSQNDLWLSVGAYKISEEFIRENLDKINKKYEDTFIVNGYKYPWGLIVQNGIKYSEKLLEENIKYINMRVLFDTYSVIYCDRVEYSADFIKKFSGDKSVNIRKLLCQKSINNMDDFIIDQIGKKNISINDLNRSEYISLKIIEKYHDDLDIDYLCYYNRNINMNYFRNTILKNDPELKINIDSYIRINNASEENIKFFIDEYYKGYDEEDMIYYFTLLKDIIDNCENEYSDEVKKIVNENNVKTIINSDQSKLASFNDDSVIYRHSLCDILNRK